MKFIFIINQLAGKGDIQKRLVSEIQRFDNCEIYFTKAENDATNYVKNYLNEKFDEEICFVACGGDGTINEVFNGAYGYKNVSVSCLPCGSGNDFVKVFNNDFKDVEKIINGNNDIYIDLMKIGNRYSNNVINFGFDTTVAEEVNIDRAKTGHGNKLSYVKGIVKALKNSMKTKAKIYADGELLNPDGELLLCSIANGQYYGGSFRCAPNSKLDDGLIDICVVKPISRIKLISIIKHYIDGTHLNSPKFKNIMTYRQVKKIEVKSDNDIAITVDGEIIYDNDFTIEIVPHALKMRLPE